MHIPNNAVLGTQAASPSVSSRGSQRPGSSVPLTLACLVWLQHPAKETPFSLDGGRKSQMVRKPLA